MSGLDGVGERALAGIGFRGTDFVLRFFIYQATFGSQT
jgi:hypothetical protein